MKLSAEKKLEFARHLSPDHQEDINAVLNFLDFEYDEIAAEWVVDFHGGGRPPPVPTFSANTDSWPFPAKLLTT